MANLHRLQRSGLLLLLVIPFSLGSKCGKKADSDLVVDDMPAAPELRLQVVSIEPDSVQPDQSFRAVVYGSAFEPGARVWIGETEIASAQYRDANTIAVSAPPLVTGSYDVRVMNPGGDSATLRGGLYARQSQSPTAGLNCNLIRVHFDFDSSSLTPTDRAELNRNLPCFQQGGATVRIEGNTDDRGTTDYNLALGQRRADAIQRYLVGQGVPPSKLSSVSYGEEQPVERGHNESAWAANRRGDIKVRQ